MKKYFLPLLMCASLLPVSAGTLHKPNPIRQHGKEEGMMLDLNKISLGTLNDVEEKKQYLSTVQLEKQRIQNYMLRQVYEEAYTLYRRGDYQRAQELAQTILSIDPNFTQAATLAKQAGHMGAYGTTSEAEVIEAKFQEANRMYDSGRLVEANEKLDEILTIQPHNSQALAWKKRIDREIADEYARRGEVAYEKGDYQSALDNWYNTLLIRKDDQALVNKIAQTENLVRKQQVKEYMSQAMSFYNQGKYLEAYSVFERISKIQPGDQRVQKYMMQLKDEISEGYYAAGNQSFSSEKYDSAINYWRRAKKWGANSSQMDRLIKKARNAKEEALHRKQTAATTSSSSTHRESYIDEKTGEHVEIVKTETWSSSAASASGTTPASRPVTRPETMLPDINTTTADINNTVPTRVSAEASAASHQKYIEGLDAYQQDDYERARAAWIAAKQLDPGNTDAEMGLRKVNELLGLSN
ncbi:MAG: hypothetical protein J6U96_02330 [Elusimicrobiaceae bacterium]|nr:hypothetical protein [Elusimicrobiaceae bacterium]